MMHGYINHATRRTETHRTLPARKSRPARRILLWIMLPLLSVLLPRARAEDPTPDTEPVLYYVATAHLDTEWRWTVRDTINTYLPDTLNQNFRLFETFPDYLFNFEGGIHYQFIKQYHPELFSRLKEAVRAGRWNISGPGLVAFDANLPAPESILRSILYAQTFYRQEFATNAPDVFLPDCFGFSYALPALAAHAGMTGFSTQKLGWNSAAGIPFRIGFWEGVDGSILPSVLHAEPYISIIRNDMTRSPAWLDIALETGTACGLPRAYHYFGTGDQGGAPDEGSVAWLQGFTTSDGPLKVRGAASRTLFDELAGASITQQPHYRGELLLTKHGTGGYTSKARIKKWNRLCEQLAAAAERASVAAQALVGLPYPQDVLTDAWHRMLLHHFHDSITGVGSDEVNDLILNDLQLAMNQYSCLLEDALTAWSEQLDTQGNGIPVVVYNPLEFTRTGLVEITLPTDTDAAPPFFRVTDPVGREVPSQRLSPTDSSPRILFAATAPSIGLAVYHIQPTTAPFAAENTLQITPTSIENQRIKLTVNPRGEIASIYDKALNCELLSAPIQRQLLPDHSSEWPQWEIDYDDLMAEPGSVSGFAILTPVETGPLRATLRIECEQGNSTFTEYISLCASGPSDRIHVRSLMDWHTTGTLVKLAVPLAFGNTNAVYDIGLGTIARTTNTPQLYEVPAHQWVDLCDTNRDIGLALLNDCKYGYDHPAAHLLRMTLLHAPNDSLADMGHHEYAWELLGHQGSWTNGVRRAAAELNQPLRAFITTPHTGTLGRSSSLLSVNEPGVQLMALKQAETGEAVVLRFAEAFGTTHSNFILQYALPVENARLLNGIEEPVAQLPLGGNGIHLELDPYALKTIALEVQSVPPANTLNCRTLPLDCDTLITRSPQTPPTPSKTSFFASRLWQEEITSARILHRLESAEGSRPNALACRGNRINLPDGNFNTLSILAVSLDKDQEAVFRLNDQPIEVLIPGFIAPIAQDDNARPGTHPQNSILMRRPPHVKDCRIAALYDYCIGTNGTVVPYTPASIFQFLLPLSPAQTNRTLVLPENPDIQLIALTMAQRPSGIPTAITPAVQLPRMTRIEPLLDPGTRFLKQATVTLQPIPPDAQIRYTLDGSRPDTQSSLYKQPLLFSASADLRARAFHPDFTDDYELRLLLKKQKPHPPVLSPPPMKPKLKFALYHGNWTTLPDTSHLTPKVTGHIAKPMIPEGVVGDHFALDFSGFLHIPKGDVYTFHLTTDDGACLYIDGVRLIHNDGLHPPIEKTATIALAAGYHLIHINYFEGADEETLDVQWASNHFTKQPIPPENLSHADSVWWFSLLQKLRLKPIIRE